jgi:hypothetical protein
MRASQTARLGAIRSYDEGETMDCTLSTTTDYHVNKLTSLGWELTVCNALYPEETPLRKLLKCNDSYGHLLYDYLDRIAPMGRISNVIEIGGGYGFLMKDFLDRDKTLNVRMLDISPFLLGKQRETLTGFDVSYRQEDFLETNPAILEGVDLVILNENLGDFPTLTNLRSDMIQSIREPDGPAVQKAVRLFQAYRFDLPDRETFDFNIGAIEALEKLCASGVPYIFLGEHSCEARVPPTFCTIVRIESRENPEKIRLMGHDEYSIKFSYLEKVARAHEYTIVRGSFADFVAFELTGELRSILAAPGFYGDRGEIICQFIEDLYKYEYLFLSKK